MCTNCQSTYLRMSSLLQQREDELRSALQSDEAYRSQSASGSPEVSDFKDAADSEAFEAIERIKKEHAMAELSAVIAAQHRLEAGTYGMCAECGEQIDQQRLLAIPYAANCVACQSLHESPRQPPAAKLSKELP